MSQIDADFLPLAQELIDGDFPTQVIYHRVAQGDYDPATGVVSAATTDYTVNAGILSSGRSEQGGASEGRQLRLWLHHGAGGLPFLPETGDSITYLGVRWKVTGVDPTYHSDALIGSKLTLNA